MEWYINFLKSSLPYLLILLQKSFINNVGILTNKDSIPAVELIVSENLVCGNNLDNSLLEKIRLDSLLSILLINSVRGYFKRCA